MHIIFKSGSFFLAGALAFTFASCGEGGKDNSNQSIVRETEERVENEEVLNEPTISYGEGEYQGTETERTNVTNYDYDREYTYDDRDMVMDRVRNDLDRTERGLETIGKRLEEDAQQLDQEMRQEWEETRQNLEDRRQELNTRLEELETANEQNWEQVRNEANKSLQEFEREWEELKNKDINLEVEDETSSPYGN